MKEIWKKTSLFYKIIAVLLTVVMVGTTMYFHFEKKYVAKAEGEISVVTAYLPSNLAATGIEKFGDEGWRVASGAVANETGRKFAYIIKVPDSINNFEYFRYTTDGNDPTDGSSDTLDLNVASTMSGFDGYRLYRVEILYGTAGSTSIFKAKYKLNGNDTEYDLTATFSWAVAPAFSMTATIGGTNIAGNSFNTLGSTSKMKVNISSPSQLTGFSVFDDAAVSVSLLGTPTYNAETLLWVYPEYEYSFSGSFTKNYTNKSVSASYGDPVRTETLEASSLIYDGTVPTVSATVNSAVFESTNWYNYNQVTFDVKSGNTEGLVNESKLASIVITEGENELFSNTAVETTQLSPIVTFTTNGTHNVAVTATDVAGNSTTENYAIKIDYNSPPVITTMTLAASQVNEVSGTKYVKLDSDKKVIMSGNVTDDASGTKELPVSGTFTDLALLVHPINNSSIISPSADTTTNEYPTNYDYSFNLGDVLDTTTVDLSTHNYDGSYSINVTPTDNAGNVGTSASVTFVLDTTNPSFATAPETVPVYGTDIIIQRHSVTSTITDENADGYWEDVPSAEIVNEKYLVNKALYSRVRYKVKATDLNFNTLKFVSGENEKQTYNVATTDDWYYCDVPLNDITKASALEYSVTATDKALNETTVNLPSLQEVNSDLTVNLVSIMYNGQPVEGEVNSITDLSTYFESNYNGVYTVTVNVTSGYKIKSVNLNKNGSIYLGYSLDDGTITNTPDDSGVYVTNDLTFILPKLTDANELLNSLSISVEDTADTPRTATVVLGDLLYDNTQPVVVNTGEYDKDKWYQNYSFTYEVKSGSGVTIDNTDTITESNLMSASYNIDDGALTAIDVSSGVKIKTGTVEIPESASVAGTKIVFDATDNATNTIDTASMTYPNQMYIKVDKTAPTVAPITVNGKAVNESVVLAGTPQFKSSITDNLTVKDYAVTVKYNDEAYAIYPVSVEKDASEEGINHTLQQVIGSKELKDGKYTVSISARDKSERSSNVAATTFIVDNTAPVVTANILSGTTGKNNGYYNSDVVVRLTCKDNNFNPAAMSVTDNGSAISADWKTGNDMYYADVTLSAEGLHNIRVSGNDKAGTAAQAKQVTFTIDKTVPTVSLLVNGGQIYNESRGTLNLTGPLTFTASVSDTNEDAGDLRVQVIKTVPDTATTTSEFLPTGERTFTFADEADYVINIFAIDKANNQGPTRTISFRVDTTAPQLTITGAGGTAASATSVSFNITEAFWSDAKGTVEIYRKAGDGVDEALYKTLTISPTQRAYSLSELLRESGIYRFEFTADDKVGHTATTSQKITVDVNKPEITLSGVNNYDSTDGAVSISAIIKDEFYASKKVSIQGTRTDAAGKKTALSFSPFAATANPTTINDTFSEEGIYDITLTATDIAGNVTSNSVHFTIDTSDPVIGDLSMYDGKTFNAKSFEDIGLDIDLDEIVSDLTVCQVRMYLNGSEYDGISEIEDGSYTLLITAEDELGHKSEKSATFVLDTKEPIFIVTGVEDGEVRNDNYNIEVSLQLDEDTLDEVKLNDKVITVKNNVASLSVSDKGEYKLYMKATDEAGNEAEQTITFTFGEEQKSVTTAVSDAVEKAASHWWIWAIVVAAILAVGGLIFFILKRRKED